jgi:hypothetical protein
MPALSIAWIQASHASLDELVSDILPILLLEKPGNARSNGKEEDNDEDGITLGGIVINDRRSILSVVGLLVVPHHVVFLADGRIGQDFVGSGDFLTRRERAIETSIDR